MEHRQMQHGLIRSISWETPLLPPTDPKTYHVSFPSADQSLTCPVERCQGRAKKRTNLWIHFLHRHVQDAVVILDEGNLPHPHCAHC